MSSMMQSRFYRQNLARLTILDLVNAGGSIPRLFTQFEVKSSSDVCTYFPNSTLDPSVILLPDIPLRIASLLRDMHLFPRFLLTKMDLNKTCGIDVIPAIDLKKCAPELTAVLSKLNIKYLTVFSFLFVGNPLLFTFLELR